MALNYYHTAHQASLRIDGHPGLEYLSLACRVARKVLDVGCGEGSRLNVLLPSDQAGWGVDINSQAIRLARRRYPRHHFSTTTPDRLPFPPGSFDLVYSAFVLEHTNDPQIFLDEIIRVCAPGGLVVILAPNFGSPNRRSPNSTQLPAQKLITGLLSDFSSGRHPGLWTRVTPRPRYDRIDADTTVEPYLRDLEHFFLDRGLTVVRKSSLWVLDHHSLTPHRLLFRLLGSLKIYPFSYWGPQLFIAVQK